MPRLSPLAKELQDWINADDQKEFMRRRKLTLKKLDEMGLCRVSDANETQAQQIRDWIASKL